MTKAIDKRFYVYMLASKIYGTLYIGVTSNLLKRVWQHKNEVVEGFTKEHRVHILVWYEKYVSAEPAIIREKQLKKWNREWKIKLLEKDNPDWSDLYESLLG